MAIGCIISEIPCLDQIEIKKISDGVVLNVDAGRGIVEVKGT